MVWRLALFNGLLERIKPGTELAKEEAEHLFKVSKGYLIQSPKNGSRFFYRWNELLRNEGFDFLKIDDKSSIEMFFTGALHLPEDACCMNKELELVASLMNGVIINSMVIPVK